jgi:glycosyltransferase involved in cell wall biosynthesis
VKLEHAYRKAVTRSRQGGFFSQVGIDLLFCPFTAPSFHDLSVPAVSIIHDLQYRYYPQFFSPEDHQCRMINFMEACRLSDRLICVSEYVRRTVLENSDLKSDRVCTIHTRLPNRVSEPAPQAVSSVLRRLGLRENEFFLYPANFWEHKNHRMLLTAFGMVHARNPGSNLRLVCPGALEKERRAWREAADRMGLGERIVLPGFMLDDDYAAILASCLALVFPSLFEGFGMPVLEAMAFRKPVICSNVTSLPEVAGDAALFIDPRNPRDMAEAMERMATDETLRKSLIDLGRRRLEVFGGPDTMAREYLDVFLNVMRQPRPTTHTKLRSR